MHIEAPDVEGALRRVRSADVRTRPTKYVMRASGAVLDVMVDMRDVSCAAGRLSPPFDSLDDRSTVFLQCSEGYAPRREHGVHPLDMDLGIAWPEVGRRGLPLVARLSTGDVEAPAAVHARDRGLVPAKAAPAAHRDDLRSKR